MAKRKWNGFLELIRLSRLRRRAPAGLAPNGLQSGLEGWAPKSSEEWKLCVAALITCSNNEAESDPEHSAKMGALASEILTTQMTARMHRELAEFDALEGFDGKA